MPSTTEQDSLEPQENEAWVKVRRRKGRRPANNKALAKTLPRYLAPGGPTLSLEQVKQDHECFAGEWTSSPAHDQLQEMLSGHTTSYGVTKAICFGLGSFDPPDGPVAWKRTSHIQLAAFLAIVEHLQRTGNRHIRCIFQDPVFSPIDKDFITSLGHEVVESPVGFQLVDSETLAFAVHVYRDVCLQMVTTDIPAMYVGTSYEKWDTNGVSDLFSIEGMARLKELDQLCVSHDFPENKAETVFSGTTIYWRKEDKS